MENISDNNTSVDIVDEEELLLPRVESVVEELRAAESKKSSAMGNISLLIITIALFFGSGFIYHSVENIFIIILVLLIHEAGHLIAMRMYGYKDVKMFFIPFIGAAVSGRNENVSSSKKAKISLAGPIPGLILVIVISVFYWGHKGPYL